jgi:tetraacyldisaccharide 4'-kinase
MMILSALRFLLFPFSLLYGCIAFLRNKLFDVGLLSSFEIPGKSIVIGNLSVGGTGKSPHTIYLNELIKAERPTAILSRGYGRKTKGCLLADESSSASQIGDEPKMFQLTSPTTPIVVAEERKTGVELIRKKFDQDHVILLDDAFQHRKIKAGFQIVLSDYSRPFYNDFPLPMGRLREFRFGRKRADLIVITKCPNKLSEEQKNQIKSKVKHNHVYFSSFLYSDLKLFSGEAVKEKTNILLCCGIANPTTLKRHLEQSSIVQTHYFADHHVFKESDFSSIREKFGNFAPDRKLIVITEKDAVKWTPALEKGWLDGMSVYVQKITVAIDKQEEFNDKIKAYVRAVQGIS